MLVIPKQLLYRAIRIEDSPEFYLNIGKYLNEKCYKIENNSYICNLKYTFIFKNNQIQGKYGDYILIDVNDNQNWIYVEAEHIDKYLKIEEGQNEQNREDI